MFYSDKIFENKFCIDHPELDHCNCFSLGDSFHYNAKSEGYIIYGNVYVIDKKYFKIFQELDIKIVHWGYADKTVVDIHDKDVFPDPISDYSINSEGIYFYNYINYEIYDEENGYRGKGTKSKDFTLFFKSKKDLAKFKLLYC